MKIAVWHNLPSGGGKRALYQHIKGLAARGHQIESWCPPTADGTYLPFSGLVAEHVLAYEPPVAPHPPRPLGRYRQRRREFDALDAHCRRCADEIDAGGFDVLLAGNCRLSAVAPIARHVRLPSLLYHQEPQRWLYEARPRLPWAAPSDPDGGSSSLRRWKDALRDYDAVRCLRFDAREERASAAAFRLLLANSAFSRESILRAYGLETKVCYLGIDAEMFRPGEEARERYAVSVGGIQTHKGIETVIAALATLPTDHRPPLVWIGNVGDPDYQQTLGQLAARSGVTMTMRNLVSDAELVDCLRRASVMIYAPHLEPFGFAPLEANACGTPVVAVAEGGVRETIAHRVNGLLVPDRDPAALGRAVAEIFDEPKLGHRLGNAGAEIVRERWTWEASVDRLEGHLQSLVGGA